MKKSIITACCVVLSMITCSQLFSQTEAVILYNSQPVKVELSDSGNIQTFIGTIPGYMEGFDMLPSSNLSPIAKVEEPKLEEGIEKNAGYSIISTEKIQLTYNPEFATLQKSTILQLNDIAAKLKAEPNAKVLLTAHNAMEQENRLTMNRLASAKTYLSIKGIALYRIQTEVQVSPEMENIIAVNYLK